MPISVQTVGGKLQPYATETLVIDATAGGIGFTATKVSPADVPPIHAANVAFVTIESNPIRYTFDGSAPSDSGNGVGHLAGPGTILEFVGLQTIKNFRAVQNGASSAIIQVTYSR